MAPDTRAAPKPDGKDLRFAVKPGCWVDNLAPGLFHALVPVGDYPDEPCGPVVA
jgi:hypothetical protein